MESYDFQIHYSKDEGVAPMAAAEAERRIGIFKDALGPGGRAHGNPREMATALIVEGEDEVAARGDALRISQDALDASELSVYFRMVDA